jgi:DNA-binding winged helix-turn-helix (wHTH) protein/TolB-like protein
MLTDRVFFGPFETNIRAGELRREGLLIPLQDLPFRLLTALLERPGEVMTRAELAERLWGTDTFVDAAAGLNTAVAKLREALGDNAEQPLYIETVPKRGYRFVARVEAAPREVRADPRVGPPLDEARGALSLSKGGADTQVRPYETPQLRRRGVVWTVAAIVAVVVVVFAAYRLRADRPQTRVAVILFDNETGRPEVSRLSQGLTDATVFALTAQPTLAVIGNAAILRTARPFRDIAAVRDVLHADYIVIGQVQTVDQAILVRSHLIRASDQAHVWVSQSRMTADEATLQSEVAGRIASAVATHARDGR